MNGGRFARKMHPFANQYKRVTFCLFCFLPPPRSAHPADDSLSDTPKYENTLKYGCAIMLIAVIARSGFALADVGRGCRSPGFIQPC